MSKVELGALVNGFSGKVGNSVLRRRGSKTYLCSVPKRKTTEPTAKEKAQRDRFRRAAAYAKGKMLDPIAKADYAQIASRKESMSAFTVAVTDYLKSPVIDSLKTDGYTGKINDVIIAKVYDDFKIAAVKVTITLPTNVLLETGAATFDATTLEWKYVATKANATVPGTKVKVTGTDRPGNETSLEKVM
jgi:hypothetical protein